MKRWNGWGDESVHKPLPEGASTFLEQRVGQTDNPQDVPLAQVVASVPDSRLKEHAGIRTEPMDRVRHARGQSLPDWIALRSGQIGTFPDGVAYPTSAEDVQDLLTYASSQGAKVIPYGGGTSVVGHINVPSGEQAPVLVVDMSRMARLLRFDEVNSLATFGAGITGPSLERALEAANMTLGHFPQSFEYSTLGGWVATRSSGQESIKYGRIEHLFAGGEVVTPLGPLTLPVFPASAAGPDLREMVLGSEGRMGIITEATVRVQPRPQTEGYQAVIFRHFAEARVAARALAQARIPLSMMRVSTPEETETILAMAGHERLTKALKWALSARGATEDKSLMILGFSGSRTATTLARKTAVQLAREFGGIRVGRAIGQTWIKNRFSSAYLRNALWDAGYAVDTLETATTWDHVPDMVEKLQRELSRGLRDEGERVHVFTHLSHVYPSGSSIYCSYIFRISAPPEQMMKRWRTLKGLASRIIVNTGGTISHQHGVGLDHAPYLEHEKGKLGLEGIRSMMRYWDPDGMMNPGKLV